MDMAELPDGGVEFFIGEETLPALSSLHDDNLVTSLSEEFKSELAERVVREFEADKISRKGWEDMLENGFKLLGLKLESTSEPFEGACAAVVPLITENAVKFQSRATLELLPAGGPAKTQIIGAITPEREQQAARIKDFLNYQMTQVMPDYYSESERLFLQVPIIGSAFSKIYHDSFYEAPVKCALNIDQFYVPPTAKTLRTAVRYTEVIYRLQAEIDRDFASGLYFKPLMMPSPGVPETSNLRQALDLILGTETTKTQLDEQYELLEQHRYERLPGDDENAPPSPYVVTVDRASKTVLAVRRNWRAEDPKRLKIVHYVHYVYVPAFGFYGLGLIHLLGNITKSATSALRVLVDAGMFANMPAGIKSKGLKFASQSAGPARPGSYQDVEMAVGQKLGDLIMPFPFKGPDPTLFQLLDYMVKAGQKFADESDQIVQNSANYGPVGTTLALLEASTRLYSAINKRLHKAQAEEFKLLCAINAQYLPPEYPYEVVGGDRMVFQTDFDGRIDVIPVSDPSAPSTSHRIAKYQLAWEVAKQLPPGTMDMEVLIRGFLAAADVPNADQLVVDPEKDVEPRDPLTDIKAAMLEKPVRAFPGQNHDAYMAIFGSFMQDPSISQNPANGKALSILGNAVREHQLAKWLLQVESVMRAGGPQQGAVPEQLMAQAAQQVMQANAAMGQGGPQNPDTMLAQAALKDAETREKSLEQKQVANAATVAVRFSELGLREQELIQRAKEAQAKLVADAATNAAANRVKTGQTLIKANTDLAKEQSAALTAEAVARLNKDARERDRDNS